MRQTIGGMPRQRFTELPARLVERARDLATGRTPLPATDLELLRAMGTLLALAAALATVRKATELAALERLLQRVRRRLHGGLQEGRRAGQLARACRKHGLEPLESEILLALAHSGLGSLGCDRDFPSRVHDLDDLQDWLAPLGYDPLEIARAVAPGSRLARAGLLSLDEVDCPIDTHLRADPLLLEDIWMPDKPAAWPVADHEELLARLRGIVAALENAEHPSFPAPVPESRPGAQQPRLRPRLRRELRALDATLREHPDWPLATATAGLNEVEIALLCVLAGRELDFASDDDCFTGRALARAICAHREQAPLVLALMRRDAPLRKADLARPCGGSAPMAHEDDRALAEAEWELTEHGRERLRITARRRPQGAHFRTPSLRLADLVLHEEVLEVFALALAQARDAGQRLREWGIEKLLPYGRGVTLLFHGPPGTGKTAAAEALAGELDRPLLAADCARLLSCWVGETEKNLARAFAAARQSGAILFFDEADSLLYDRSGALRSWEVTAVNVLLQEIERCEGVCILATNRLDALDPALERRMSLRAEFRPPDTAMRRAIWQRLLPPTLPLAADVDLDRLAALPLTGGQIKNAVLNAVRRALRGDGKEKITMAALEASAQLEASGRIAVAMGFQTRSQG